MSGPVRTERRGSNIVVEDSFERAERLMLERAKRLASARDEQTERSEVEVLAFQSGDQSYAVKLEDVEAIARVHHVTALPGAPGHLLGLTRLRGRFITLLDVRTFLLASARGLADVTSVVAVRSGKRVIGLAASDLEDVLALPERTVRGARPAADGLTRALMVESRSMALIDVPLLLSHPSLSGGDAGGGRS